MLLLLGLLKLSSLLLDNLLQRTARRRRRLVRNFGLSSLRRCKVGSLDLKKKKVLRIWKNGKQIMLKTLGIVN